MPRFHVLLTDAPWDNFDLERSILAEAEAELIRPEAADVPTLAAAARDLPADAIITNWSPVPGEVIGASPQCRIVARLGVGVDNIDVEYCTQHNIPVTNVPDYCTIEVAEHALALVMSLGRDVAWHHAATKAGDYALLGGPPLRRMTGQTLGVVGLGRIGISLAEKALGLGMKVIGTSRSPAVIPDDMRQVTLHEVLRESDYVALCAPLTDDTRHLINRETLAEMKPTAYLINTARGGLIDHEALAEALAAGKLAGAGLDVQTPEPPDMSQPPYNDPRVVVTPHIAFVSQESLEDLRTRVCRQVVARLTGSTPENILNGVA